MRTIYRSTETIDGMVQFESQIIYQFFVSLDNNSVICEMRPLQQQQGLATAQKNKQKRTD